MGATGSRRKTLFGRELPREWRMPTKGLVVHRALTRTDSSELCRGLLSSAPPDPHRFQALTRRCQHRVRVASQTHLQLLRPKRRHVPYQALLAGGGGRGRRGKARKKVSTDSPESLHRVSRKRLQRLRKSPRKSF